MPQCCLVPITGANGFNATGFNVSAEPFDIGMATFNAS